MSTQAARRAVEQVCVETQQDLLDRLRFDVAVLRADMQTSEARIRQRPEDAANVDVASSVRSKADQLAAEAADAEARMTDDELLSELRSDVIDVVAAIRKSAAYQASSAPAASPPPSPPLPASFLTQDSWRR